MGGVQGQRLELHPRLRPEDGVRWWQEHGLRAVVRQPRGGEEVRAEAPLGACGHHRGEEDPASSAQGHSQEAEEAPREGEGEGWCVETYGLRSFWSFRLLLGKCFLQGL